MVLEVPKTIGPYTSMGPFKCMPVVHFGGFRFRRCWFWGVAYPTSFFAGNWEGRFVYMLQVLWSYPK